MILVLGDSLSAAYGIPIERGWVSLLARRLHDQGYPHRVVNASISGETTRGALDRLSAALEAHRPAVVLVELGANDGLRGIPIAEVSANLTRIVKAAQASGAKVLLLSMRLPPNYGPAYVGQFEGLYERVADDTQATLAPFLLQGVAGDPQYVQDDGLHPGAAAHPIMLRNIWPALEPLLQGSARLVEP
ncbi:MAG: arylesterase [Chromatiales bacterium]